MHLLVLIVFLPIIAALIAGLGGPWIGKTAAKVVTTGAPDNHVVSGDVWLVGGGDPLLMTDPYVAHFKYQPVTHTSLEALADEIVASGVHEVTGSIVGDDSRYDQLRYLPQWPSRFATEAEVACKEGRSYETGEQLLARILKKRRAEWEADRLAKMHSSGKLPTNDEWKKKYREPDPPETSNLTSLPEGWVWANVGQLAAVGVGQLGVRLRRA